MRDAVFTKQFPDTIDVPITGASQGPASPRPFVSIRSAVRQRLRGGNRRWSKQSRDSVVGD